MAGESIALIGGIYPRGFSTSTDWPWPLVKSEEIVTLNYGKALRAGDRRTGQVPVYGTNGQCGWHDAPLASGPGVILGRKGQGPLGVEWCDSGYWVIDTAYFVTRKTDDLDLRYFYYLVKYVGLNHLKDGTSNPSLSRDTFADLLLPIPPLAEQNAIAEILGGLDAKIELNRRMNQTLESLARAIFKSWFVDFDPVRAKMDGRPPPGLDPETAALFPDKLQHQNGDLIPAGWDSGPLKQVAELQTNSVSPGGQPLHVWEHYSIPAFDDRKRPARELGSEIKSNKYIVPTNCVLVSKLNPQFPRVWLPDIQNPEVAICSTEFMPFVPRKSEWRSFLYETVWSDSFQAEIQARATGSTGSRQRVKPKEVAEIPIVVPPEPLIDAFGSASGPLHEQQLANIRESETLAALRDTLLPKLLSGELRVGEAERTIEEVV